MSKVQRVNRLKSQLSGSGSNVGAKVGTDVLYKVSDGIATISINRPQRLNAVTMNTQLELTAAFKQAGEDNDVKVVILTGEGRAFCAGADFDLLGTLTSGDSKQESLPQDDSVKKDIDPLAAIKIPKPVIAAVNGPVAGLGFVYACSADIRFAVKSAKWTTAFAKRGLVAEYGLASLLPRIVGFGNASDLLFSSRVMLSEEAKQMGLVQKLFDTREAMMDAAQEYAKEVVTWCSPVSMAEMKDQLREGVTWSTEKASAYASFLMEKTFRHPDSKEGISSYSEKRKPVFPGLSAGRIKEIQ